MAIVTRHLGYPIDPARPFLKGQKVVIAFEVWGPMDSDQIKEFNSRFDDLLNPRGTPIGVRIGSERAKMMPGDGPDGPKRAVTRPSR